MPIEIAWTVAPAIIVFLLTLVIVRTEFEVRVNPQPRSRRRQAAARHRHRPSMVVGIRDRTEATSNRPASSPPTNCTCRRATRAKRSAIRRRRSCSTDLSHAAIGRCLPQLLGSATGRQNRSDSRPQPTRRGFKPPSPACTSASAPNIAARSTPTCCCECTSIRPTNSPPGWPTKRKPAVDDSSVREGKQAFLAQSCVNCHTIRGTAAQGKFGPDLTHLGRAQTIGGGMIELNRDELAQMDQQSATRSKPAA